jgi:RimJ/RimL family protein N-acetyltransferase
LVARHQKAQMPQPGSFTVNGSAGQPALPPYQIHHYPATLIDTRSAAGGRRFTLRPVLPQDDLLLAELVAGLSPAARRNRFFGAVNLPLARLRQMASVDYQQQLGLVVTTQVDGSERVVADARYCIDTAGDGDQAEFALMVDEHWRRKGLGCWALQSLKQAAAKAGLTWLHAEVRDGNDPMLSLAQRCGFAANPDPEDELVIRVHHRLNGHAPLADVAPRGLLGWLRRALPGRAQVLS